MKSQIVSQKQRMNELAESCDKQLKQFAKSKINSLNTYQKVMDTVTTEIVMDKQLKYSPKYRTIFIYTIVLY